MQWNIKIKKKKKRNETHHAMWKAGRNRKRKSRFGCAVWNDEERRGEAQSWSEGNYTRAEPGRMSRMLPGSWFERVTGGRAGNIGYIRADTGRLVSITIAPVTVFYASVE